MESLLEFVERGARAIREDFTDPEDDWTPVLFVKDSAGKISVVGIPIGEDKDMAAAMIGAVLRAMEGREAVLLTSAWSAQFDNPEDAENTYLPPSMCENRKEILLLTYVGFAGIASCKSIPINRHGNKPPTLGKAEAFESFDGRFVDAMRRGMKVS